MIMEVQMVKFKFKKQMIKKDMNGIDMEKIKNL